MSPRSRNSNGAGSVFRRKDGKWVAQVWDPVQEKKVQRYAPTQREARALLQVMLGRTEQGVSASDVRTSIRVYATDWLERRAGRRRSGNTVRTYRYRLEKYVFDRLGHIQVGSLTVVDVERLLDALVAQGLSHSSVKGVKESLSAMYTDGIRDRVLAFNPVQRAQLPIQGTRPATKSPTTEEIKALFAAADRAPEGHAKEVGRLMQLLILTGARIGEALSARWSDIDLQAASWTVRSTLTFDDQGNRMVGDMTKTGKERTVAISPALATILHAQKRAIWERQLLATIWGEQDFVFPDAKGGALDPSNARNALKRHYPEWGKGFHVIRRWFISLGLSDSGVGAVQVARLVGHAKTSTTTDIYGSALPEGSMRIVQHVEAAVITKQKSPGFASGDSA